MEPRPDREECRCGFPERYAADPDVPVEFDEEMGEYELHSRDGRNAFVMRFCFWCGGALPESKRGEFFTQPSEEDVADVRRLLAGAETAEDAVRALGPPDETFDEPCGGVETPGEPPVSYRHVYRYSTRWPTLELDINEYPDGRCSYFWGGRYLGDGEDEE